MKIISKNKVTIIGLILGAFAGYMYYSNVSCSGGTCVITSSPVITTAYGALFGALLFTSFKRKSIKQ